MARLDKEQKKFLKQLHISHDLLFDASGLTRSEYFEAMKLEEKRYAYGVTPCKRAGHSLRNSSGNCIQCFPASISYTNNHSRAATVYLVGSIEAGLIKVGTSNELEKRVSLLNQNSYGRAKDWKWLCFIYVEQSGKLEDSMKNDLSSWHQPTVYWKDGHWQNCKECFSCKYTLAKIFLQSLLPPAMWVEIVENDAVKLGRYDFN